MATDGFGTNQQKLNAGKTDLEKFVELYRGFGIECKVNEVEVGEYGYLEGFSADQKLKVIALQNSEIRSASDGTTTFSEKIVGNAYTKLVFSNEGKFIEQGIWE
jgi:hypothetical protein